MKSFLSRKKLVVLIAVLVLVVGAGTLAFRYRAATGAYVNGERITLYTINKKLEHARQMDPGRFSGPGGPEAEREFRRGLLEEAVFQRLVGQNALKSGITVSEGEIDNELAKRKRLIGSTKDYRKFLANEGLTESQFRDIIRDELAGLKMRIRLAGQVKVTAKEVDETLKVIAEELSSPQPQVKLSALTTNKAENAAKAARALKNGAAFSATARKYADQDYPVDLGWQLKRFLDKNVDKAVSEIEPGEHTSVLPNPDNSVSIYRLDNRAERVSTAAELRRQVEDRVLRVKQNRAYQNWLERIHGNAEVQLYI